MFDHFVGLALKGLIISFVDMYSFYVLYHFPVGAGWVGRTQALSSGCKSDQADFTD